MKQDKVIETIDGYIHRNPLDPAAYNDMLTMVEGHIDEQKRIMEKHGRDENVWKDAKRELAEWHEFNRQFRPRIIRAATMLAGEGRYADVERINTFFRRSLFIGAPEDFDAFMLYIEQNRKPEDRFYVPRRKNLKRIVDAFQRVQDGKLDLLTVSQPKRTGKTTLGTWFVLFREGRNPAASSVCCGAGDTLVKSFYNGMLEVLSDKEKYLFYDVFPNAKLAGTNADEKTINLKERRRFASITCRSIDGALTGSTEATPDGVLYMDDLVANEEEAMNRNRLDILWNKVTGDLLGRRLEGCPIIAQGTRYSLYDPIGHLQEVAPTMGWRTEILEIPALDPVTDESNFEIIQKGKPMFTTEYYRKERDLVSEMQWESQFQQHPFESKGRLFPDGDLNRYFKLPTDKDPDVIMAVCDTAEGCGDSVMMPIAYIYGDDVFIEDCVFSNATPEHTKPECAKKLVEHKVVRATFESNNAGQYFARDVGELVEKMGGKVSIRTKRTVTKKTTRIEMASDGILKHFYFKDKSLYKPGSEYGAMMRELTTYTRTGKVPHDDSPDGLALLENEIRSMGTSTIEIVRRPI